jgi:hypothetical protein
VADRRRTGEYPDDAARPDRSNDAPAPGPGPNPNSDPDPERDRRLRRARFLAELAEARELRKRVAPRRARAAELHARVLRTFRY